MNITKDSTDLMRFFFKDFDKEISNKSSRSQKKTDAILLKLHNDIKKSSEQINSLMINNSINKFIKKGKLPNSDLLQSTYVDEQCRKYIDKNVNYLQVNAKIFDKNITIYFTLFEKSINIDKYSDSIKNILILLRFLLSFSTTHKKGSLVLYLFLTPIKKTLPKTSISILNQSNVNTAVTTSCNPHGSVLIYRKEEWFKVLIHELHHVLCLDFSGMEYNNLKQSMSNLFKIKSEYNVAETYSEFWATIINCLFCSYNLLDDNCDTTTFLLYSEFFIEFERIFSIFQTIKILDFMGLNYKEMISNDTDDIQLKYTLYREKTNVFCYYILKTILLYNYDEFILFCEKNNNLLIKFRKSPQNFKNLLSFVNKYYRDTNLIKSLTKKHIYKMFYNMKTGIKFPYKDSIINTMRMTITEIKLY